MLLFAGRGGTGAMASFYRLFLAAILLVVSLPVIGEDAKIVPVDTALGAADQLYRAGKFAEAESSYRTLLGTDPKPIPAQVGLVRAMLRQQKIDEALDSANQALAAQPNSAPLLAAKGDVFFRRGEMSDAEIAYLSAKKADPKDVSAHLGLARLYGSYSLYRQAYDQLQSAHQIAPDDIEVQRAWLRMLPRKERRAALEAYLAGPHPDDQEETTLMTEYLEFLEATADKPVHRCRLVSKVEHTETRLEFMHGENGHRVRGIGVVVKLNDRSARLLLDTGAGGIIVGHRLAEKAGLSSVSTRHYAGIGDKGLQSGYTAVADHIRIGELEYEDCIVSVSSKNSVGDEDGLIGADVFGPYLIDLDLPGMQLKLSPLPKRPEDAVPATSLNTEAEEPAHAEQKDAAAQPSPTEQPSPVIAATTLPLPRDRYMSPEMAQWTKVFRFGHSLLVPTWVNDSKPMLFILDTGAFDNILSVRAGRQVGKVSSDDRLRVHGLNGEVHNVYSSAKANLRFAHFQQTNLDMVTLDLSALSRRTGTEVSGFLGFNMLRMLEVKLDYRDGLVDFVYDPKRLH